MKEILSALCCAFVLSFSAQNAEPVYQSNPALSFSSFRTGVKVAYVAFSEELTAHIQDNPACPEAEAKDGVVEYLEANGFEDVRWGSVLNTPQNLPSLCEMVVVKPEWMFADNVFSEISIQYISCRNDIYTFATSKPIPVFSHTDIRGAFVRRLQALYGYKKSSFTFDYSLMMDGDYTAWNEEKLVANWKDKGFDNVEGIYESMRINAAGQRLKLALRKHQDNYQIIYLSGAENYLDWQEGELKGKIIPTATASVFKCEWKRNNKSLDKTPYMTFDKGMMNLVMAGRDKEIFLKLYPTAQEREKTGATGTTGSGFAVSSGYIVTNYHVVRSSNEIRVRGINGDMSRSYHASILMEDRSNDLVVLKIDDPDFQGSGQLPYAFTPEMNDVGSDVFVLGYPLPASMGTEIKLTNGIVSSRSGYQGDQTTYQVSAPVQPGNSGGPVFDRAGRIVGVVNARHTGADHATYAIKPSFLERMVSMIPNMQIANDSPLAGMPLPEQVRQIRDFVYMIEVN